MDLARNAWKDVKPMVISKFGKYCRDLEYLFLVDLLDNNTIPFGWISTQSFFNQENGSLIWNLSSMDYFPAF